MYYFIIAFLVGIISAFYWGRFILNAAQTDGFDMDSEAVKLGVISFVLLLSFLSGVAWPFAIFVALGRIIFHYTIDREMRAKTAARSK